MQHLLPLSGNHLYMHNLRHFFSRELMQRSMMPWYRCGQGCKHFPRSLCSWEFYKVFGWGSLSSGSLVLAGLSMVLRPYSPPRWFPLEDSGQERPSFTGCGHNIPPPARDLEALGLASEGNQFLNVHLSAKVVETILNSKSPLHK